MVVESLLVSDAALEDDDDDDEVGTAKMHNSGYRCKKNR